MAFPQIRGRTESGSSTQSTTLTINFDQGSPLAGDLCIAFIALDDTARTITPTESFTNWTNISATYHIIYKILDGTEGTSTTVTLGTASRFAAIAYTFQRGTFSSSIVPGISTVATGTSTSPDATSCAPTGSAKDYFWISAFRQNGEEADDDTWCTSAPTTPGTFTNLLQKTSGTTGTATTNGSLASAEYTSNASSLDAGAFATAQNLAWRAYTVGVYPVQSGTFTANAVIKAGSGTKTLTSDAIRKSTQSGVLYIGNNDGTGGAWFVATISVTDKKADAVIKANSGIKTFSANAIVFANSGTKTLAANAIVYANSGTKTFPADAIVRKTWATGAQAFTADAIATATISTGTSFSANSVLLATLSVADKAIDATLLATISNDSTDFSAEAWVQGVVAAPVWTTPISGVGVTSTPTFAFTMPDPPNPTMFFHMQIDTADTFDTANLREYKSNFSQTGWEYWDGDSWEAVPATGVPDTYAGNEARYTIQAGDELTTGTWYRRVRAG